MCTLYFIFANEEIEISRELALLPKIKEPLYVKLGGLDKYFLMSIIVYTTTSVMGMKTCS